MARIISIALLLAFLAPAAASAGQGTAKRYENHDNITFVYGK